MTHCHHFVCIYTYCIYHYICMLSHTLTLHIVIIPNVNSVITVMDITTSPCPYQLHYHPGVTVTWHSPITVTVSASLSPWSDGYMTFTNHHEHHPGSTVTSPSPRVDGFFYQSQRFSFGSIIDKFWDLFPGLRCAHPRYSATLLSVPALLIQRSSA